MESWVDFDIDKNEDPTIFWCPISSRHLLIRFYMGVSNNRGTPKWMVCNGNPIKMDDLEAPLFLETSWKHPYIMNSVEHLPSEHAKCKTSAQAMFMLRFFRLCKGIVSTEQRRMLCAQRVSSTSSRVDVRKLWEPKNSELRDILRRQI